MSMPETREGEVPETGVMDVREAAVEAGVEIDCLAASSSLDTCDALSEFRALNIMSPFCIIALVLVSRLAVGPLRCGCSPDDAKGDPPAEGEESVVKLKDLL